MHVLACPKTVIMTMYLFVGGGEIFDLHCSKADRHHHQLLAVYIVKINCYVPCVFTLVTALSGDVTKQAIDSIGSLNCCYQLV